MSNQDPAKIYYAEIESNKKIVNLRNLEKRLIRRFSMSADVVNAQVSGYGDDTVIAIVMNNGQTHVYSASGRLIRR